MADFPNTSGADASPPFDHDIDYDEYYSEFAAFLSDPSSSSDMRKTARGSLKQSLCAGGGTLTGSLIGGPVGGLVGGVAGSIIGYLKSDDYSGVLNGILKLQGEARKKLITRVTKVLKTAGVTTTSLEEGVRTFRETLIKYSQRNDVRDGIWKACVDSVRD